MSKNIEKIKYQVIKPILFMGGRAERGEVINMTKEEARNIGEDYVKPFTEENSETDGVGEDDTATKDTEGAEGTDEEPKESGDGAGDSEDTNDDTEDGDEEKENSANTGEGEGEPEMMDKTLIQEDFDNNPGLAEQGLKVGDVIQIPVNSEDKGDK